MTSVLRVYDPAECDERGVPLDWERCQTCNVDSDGTPIHPPGEGTEGCPACGGHGSLKAVALAAVEERIRASLDGPSFAFGRHRCEGCGHPMGDGTWESPQGPPSGAGPGGVWGPPDPIRHAAYLRAVLSWLADGGEAGPEGDPLWAWVHWSPCDEWCEHEYVTEERTGLRWVYADPPYGVAHEPVPATAFDDEPLGVRSLIRGAGAIEASWRAVDVRTLGEPSDLRPEKLAVLCLRCLAERGQ